MRVLPTLAFTFALSACFGSNTLPFDGGLDAVGPDSGMDASVPDSGTWTDAGTKADPRLLPDANYQVPISPAEYRNLPYFNATGTVLGTNPVNMPVGSYYVDPISQVKVVRLTSATAPMPTSANSSGPDYSSGGIRIGRPTEGKYPLVLQTFDDNGNGAYHIVEFDIHTYAVRKRMDCPGSNHDIARAFSLVEPNVLFTVDDGVIHKWNVAGSSAVEVTVGGFPKNLSDRLHGASFFSWLQVSVDDRWFSMRPAYDGDWIVSWDRQTNTVYEIQLAFDEHKQDKSGRYVLITNSDQIWDPVTGQLRTFSGAAGKYLGHNDTARGYGFGADGNNNPSGHYYVQLDDLSPRYVEPNPTHYISNLYTSGGWVDQPADLSQWVCLAHQTGGGTSYPNMALVPGGIALATLSGSQLRLLGHNYGTGNVNGTPNYYSNSVWPNLAPDGRFLLFKSNQLVAGGLGFSFAAILPTAP